MKRFDIDYMDAFENDEGVFVLYSEAAAELAAKFNLPWEFIATENPL